MLRGAQTAGELRIACERLYRFADLSSVEAYLSEMAGRSGGALVVKLAKQPGSREHRWMHLLSGAADPTAAEASTPRSEPAGGASVAALHAEVEALREEGAELRAAGGERGEGGGRCTFNFSSPR